MAVRPSTTSVRIVVEESTVHNTACDQSLTPLGPISAISRKLSTRRYLRHQAAKTPRPPLPTGGFLKVHTGSSVAGGEATTSSNEVATPEEPVFSCRDVTGLPP